jgi:hypothetical protein
MGEYGRFDCSTKPQYYSEAEKTCERDAIYSLIALEQCEPADEAQSVALCFLI